MSNDLLLDSRVLGDTPGKVLELYGTLLTFKNKQGDDLAKHHKGKSFIRGFVPEDFMPSNGGTFKMYHHTAVGKQKFGRVVLKNCQNVIVQGDYIYFENETRERKYVLVPCQLN